jgi:hypothetical protein
MEHKRTDAKESKSNMLALALSDGGKPAMVFQAGALLALRDLGVLQHVSLISASGSGCMLLSLLLDTVQQSHWAEFVTPPRTVMASQDAAELSVTIVPPAATAETKLHDGDEQEEDHHHSDKTRLLNSKPDREKSVKKHPKWSQGPYVSQFILHLTKYCQLSQERVMGIARMANICRWCGTSSGWEFRQSLGKLDGSIRSARDCELPTDASFADHGGALPVIIFESAILKNETTPPADKKSGKEYTLLGHINTRNCPSDHKGLPIQFSLFPSRLTILELGASVALPAQFGDSEIILENPANTEHFVPGQPATNLDPLALQAIQLYKIKLELGPQCLILLDGFTNSRLAKESSDTVRKLVLDQHARLAVTGSTGSSAADQEQVRCYRQACMLDDVKDLIQNQAKRLAECDAMGYRLTSMSHDLFFWLLQAGYEIASLRYAGGGGAAN